LTALKFGTLLIILAIAISCASITASSEGAKTMTEKMDDLSQGIEDSEAPGSKPNSNGSESNLLSNALGASKEISLQIKAGNYNVIKDMDGYDCIEMDGYPNKYVPGEPLLPCGVLKVLLPPNVDYSTLKLEIISEERQPLDGTYKIRPAPEDLPQNQELGIINGTSQSEAIKNQIYSADAAYPIDYVKLLPPSQMRKWQFVPVQFVPFQYNPVQGTLTLIKTVKFKIYYELKEQVSANELSLLEDTIFDSLAPEMFINYDDMGSIYLDQRIDSLAPGKKSDAKGTYVIITTNAIRAGSKKLNSFIAHKRSLGYKVRIITETNFASLNGQSPNNRAEKIRQWLKNNYVSLGIKYVLLIGNPAPYESGEGDIPMKMCWPRHGEGSDENCPTDAFYADLTGNWDINENGYFGEWEDFAATGGVDFSAEIYVARIPVYYEDYKSLDGILQKTISYEKSCNTAWRRSALLPMSFSDYRTDGAYLGEQMKNSYLTPRGYSCWRMYEHGEPGYCYLKSIFDCEENLIGGSIVPNRWEGSDFGIVCWWAHGSTQGAYVYCGLDAFMQSFDAPKLDNSHPSHTYQGSCDNGYPEDPNNLQYAILKNGGITTTSATRVSWYSPGQTNFAMSTTNAGMGYEYIRKLVEDKAAADALMQVKMSMVPPWSTRLMNYYDFNVYGDPSVSIKNPYILSRQCQKGGIPRGYGIVLS
jgi:hypothetical protein